MNSEDGDSHLLGLREGKRGDGYAAPGGYWTVPESFLDHSEGHFSMLKRMHYFSIYLANR